MEGRYEITVSDLNPSVDTTWADMNTALTDWTCETSLVSSYFESMANHQGVKKHYQKTETKNQAVSYFANPKIQSTFFRDMNIHRALTLTLNAKCTNSKMKNNQMTSIEIVEYQWHCSFSKLPKKIGHYLKSDCEVPQSKSSSFKIDPFLNMRLQEKKLIAKVKLKEIKEVFTHDLCQGKNLKHRKIIKFSQGLQGSFAEDDFTLTVFIEGYKKPVQIRSQSGIYNDEIALCRQDDRIKVYVSAKEEDPIWDDHYQVLKGSSASVFLSTVYKNEQTAKINFIRDNSWDRTFTDYKQQVKLEILSAPIFNP